MTTASERRRTFVALATMGMLCLTTTAVAQRKPTAPSKPPPIGVGTPSPDSENANSEADMRAPPPARGKLALAGLSGTVGLPLREHPNGLEILQKIASALAEVEVSVAPIWGAKYMANDCLGLKASAGSFLFRLQRPNARFAGTGAVLTFLVDRVSMNALTLRMRPNPNNLANPCTFGGRFTVGGSASNVRYEYRFDPILNMQECKLGSVLNVKTRWHIGGLNLQPLQNNLDAVAAKMIEEGLNHSTNYLDQVIATTNAVLKVKCSV